MSPEVEGSQFYKAVSSDVAVSSVTPEPQEKQVESKNINFWNTVVLFNLLILALSSLACLKIPLFDIDQTLIGGAYRLGHDAFDHIFKTIFNLSRASTDQIETPGMIDPQIIREVAKLNGVSDSEIESKLVDAMREMGDFFVDNQDQYSYELMRGAVELLDELEKLSLTMGILTGNLEVIGKTKLRIAGLDKYFSFGAFGSMASLRPELVPIALDQVRELQPDAKLQDLVIIGDSPNDIRCAQETGIAVIAVGAGNYSATDLESMNPDLVVESLEDQEPIIKFLGVT